MYICGLMVSKSMFHFSGPRAFAGRGEHGFEFQFWYSKPSVKNQWGEKEKA